MAVIEGLLSRTGLLPRACGAIAACALLLFSVSSQPLSGQQKGGPRLVSTVPLMPEGATCLWADSPAVGQVRPAAPQGPLVPGGLNRAPVRVIHDEYPTFSAVAIDPVRHEMILQDENLFQIMVFDRTATSKPGGITKPKRIIGGPKTKVNFNCALYVDVKNGDIYSINNDVVDTMSVFSRESKGNLPPTRALKTPHRAYGLAVSEPRDELFIAVQHPPRVVVFRKGADAKEAPLRTLGGAHTGLADPHGIAVDTKHGVMYVSNHGAYSVSREGMESEHEGGINRENMIAGSGRYQPPSITVHALTASGDAPATRTIAGPKTQLNWPSTMAYDEQHDELFVANDVENAILVFRGSDSGDVAPTRVLQGARTGLKNPTGVALDLVNRELAIANMGNHTATVYPIDAQGDVAPKRIIRAAPDGKIAQMIGNPGALTFDTKREEVLVPN